MNIQELVKNATLVDVRDELELLVDGSISSAINIPMTELEERADEFKDMPKPIVLFCKSGGRAGRALEYLSSQGIKDLHNAGGYVDIKDWV